MEQKSFVIRDARFPAPDAIEITIYGLPAPQGSKTFMGMSKAGHPIMVEACKRLKPWRELVAWTAKAVGGHISGPICAYFMFTLLKPRSAPAKTEIFPDGYPDGDKLTRAIFDSLTTAGLIDDDARILSCTFTKLYPFQHKDTLPKPGVFIRIVPAIGWIKTGELAL